MMSGGMFFFLFQNCLNITKPPCPETLLSGLGCWDSALPWETLSITTHDLGMSVAFLHYFWPILFRLFLQLWCLVHIPRVQQIVQTYFCRELLLACWGWVDKTRQIFFLEAAENLAILCSLSEAPGDFVCQQRFPWDTICLRGRV